MYCIVFIIIQHQEEDDSTMRRSNRARKDINYNFQEYDDLIDGAIECNQTHKKADNTRSASTDIEVRKNDSRVSSLVDNYAGKKSFVERNNNVRDGKNKMVEEYDSFSNVTSSELDSSCSSNLSDDIVKNVANDAVSEDCLITISPSVVKDVTSRIDQGVISQNNEYSSIPSVPSSSTDVNDADMYSPTDSEWNSLSERYKHRFRVQFNSLRNNGIDINCYLSYCFCFVYSLACSED